jgi:hypothetical protein
MRMAHLTYRKAASALLRKAAPKVDALRQVNVVSKTQYAMRIETGEATCYCFFLNNTIRNMSTFIITFRIAADNRYQSRYNSFVAAVADISAGGSIWQETSSFYALVADGTARSVCDQIYFGSEFDASQDQMVVISLSDQEWASRGEVKYPYSLSASLGFAQAS